MSEGIIVGRQGMYRSAIIPIKEGESLVFGRDAAVAQIIISSGSAKVSRKHCQVVFAGAQAGFEVTDYSKNGTFISGKRIGRGKSILARPGSVMSIGNENNSFVLGAPLDDQTTIGLMGTSEFVTKPSQRMM